MESVFSNSVTLLKLQKKDEDHFNILTSVMVVVVITTAGVEEKEKELELAAHLAHGYHLWKSQLSVPLLYWHSVENKHHQSKTTTCSVIITSKACKTICKYILWHLLRYILSV